jgi:hypothetical protein
MRGVGGVEGAVWDTAEIVGTARGVAEVGEVGDEGATQGRVVGPPGVMVGPPASIQRAV